MSEVIIIIHVACRSGGMADAHGSGPCVGNNMRVQVPSPALELSGAMVKFISPLKGAYMRKCRNWQTSKTKDLVTVYVVWVQVPSSALNKRNRFIEPVPFWFSAEGDSLPAASLRGFWDSH